MNVKESFKKGIGRLKWLAGILSERIKVEFAVIKLLSSSDRLKDRRAELARKVGERAFELREHTDAFILKDAEVKNALYEMEALEKEMKELREQASAIGKIEE